MSRAMVDIALVEIDGKEIDTAISFSVTKSTTRNVVKTMNRRRRAIGRTEGVPDFSVSMTVAVPSATDRGYWDDWLASGEERLIAYEKTDGGERRSLRDCTLDSIEESYSESGEMTLSLSITALDEKVE